MTRSERLVKAESILRRQKSGKITHWEGAAEFDKLLDAETGDLHFFSDTTRLRDYWNGDLVMVLPKQGTVNANPLILPEPSNTGLITQGERRGCMILKPGENESDAVPELLKEWGNPGERKWNPDTACKGKEVIAVMDVLEFPTPEQLTDSIRSHGGMEIVQSALPELMPLYMCDSNMSAALGEMSKSMGVPSMIGHTIFVLGLVVASFYFNDKYHDQIQKEAGVTVQ